MPFPSLLTQPHCSLVLSEDYLLSAAPPASAEPTQSKADVSVTTIAHWKQGDFAIYSQFLALQTAFSPLIKVSLDEHQCHYDTRPPQHVSPKLLGHPDEKKG